KEKGYCQRRYKLGPGRNSVCRIYKKCNRAFPRRFYCRQDGKKGKEMKSNFIKVCLLVLTSALIMFVSVSDAAAQTKKKKRVTHRVTAAKTKPQATGEAGVVSLADQYQDGSSQIINPSSTPTSSPELPDETAKKLRDMQSRIKKLETGSKPNDDDKQKRLLTNLDILTKAEQRAEALRKQRFEL